MICHVKFVPEYLSVSTNLRSRFHKPPYSLQISIHVTQSKHFVISGFSNLRSPISIHRPPNSFLNLNIFTKTVTITNLATTTRP
jgi:hypothetical protein